MAKGKQTARCRVGRVTYYLHHGSWYLYFRDEAGVQRCRVGPSQAEAEQRAAVKNAELAVAAVAASDLSRRHFLTTAAALIGGGVTPNGGKLPAHDLRPVEPTAAQAELLSAVSLISVQTLRKEFLEHHEHVIASSLPTVRRYTAATQHLIRFAEHEGTTFASEISAGKFARYLRSIEVAPNGHRNTERRPLSDKTIAFTLQACGSMYRFGTEASLLPNDAANPFKLQNPRTVKSRRGKPVFVFDADAELRFLRAADPWTFALQFVIAKTGVRPGELVHALIEDLDLAAGWLRICGKAELGWCIKTGIDRSVPLHPAVVRVLQSVIGDRTAGPVFLRQNAAKDRPPELHRDRGGLGRSAKQRLDVRRQALGRKLSRREEETVLKSVWRDAGAVRVDRIRTTFMAVAKRAGISATCPKSWRHTFATLLQEANVDPLIRQITLGHQPARPEQSALGMTSVYTHTTPALQQQEILRALQLRPESLALGHSYKNS